MPITIQQHLINIKNAGDENYTPASALIAGSIQDINDTKNSGITAIDNETVTKKAEITSHANSVMASVVSADEIKNMFAGTFNTDVSYFTGQYVIQVDNSINKLFRFIANHPAGAWTGSDTIEVTLGAEMSILKPVADYTLAAFDYGTENFESGSLPVSTGAPTANVKRIRSKTYIPSKTAYIGITNGYAVMVLKYDTDDTYIGAWNGSEFSSTASTSNYRAGSIDMRQFDKTKKYRIVMKALDESDITASAALNLFFYAATDTSLSLDGCAADAGEIGRKIDEILPRNMVNTPIPIYKGQVVVETGDNLSSAGSLYRTGYIDISNLGSAIVYSRYIGASSSPYAYGMTFYTSKSVEGHIAGSGQLIGYNANPVHYELSTVDVPEGAVYARFSLNASGANTFQLYSKSQYDQTLAKKVYDSPNIEDTMGNRIALTSSDDLNNLSDNCICFFPSSSVPANAPFTNKGGEVANFKYDGTYQMQVYMNGSNDYCARLKASAGYTDWVNMSRPKYELPINIVKGVWNPRKGTITTSGIFKSICADTKFELKSGSILTFYLDEGWTYTIYSGDASTNLNRTAYLSTNREYVVKNKYNAIQFNKFVDGVSVNLSASDFHRSVIIETSGDAVEWGKEYHDFPETIGQLNVVYRAYQMSKINYVTQAVLPRHKAGSMAVTTNDAAAGTQLKGIPYSSMRERMDYVPQAISFHAFRTMIENPNSYLYTKHYEQASPGYNYNSRCYAGAVCSSLVGYAYGIEDAILTTISFVNYPGFTQLPAVQQTPYSLKIGDMLNKAGEHIVIITDIIRNERGKISKIEVTEAWKPQCRTVQYTPGQIQSEYFSQGFIAYRYDNISDVSYTPSPWVAVDSDETESESNNTILCPRRGEQSNWKYGENVEIDVLDNSDEYTGYEVKNAANNTAISTGTLTDGQPIILTNLSEGKYSVTLTKDGAASNAVRFDVIQAAPTYTAQGNNKVRVDFSSATNRTPSVIYWCCNVVSDSDYKAVRAFHILTAEEIAAGYAIVDEPSSRSTDSNNGTWLMRVGYKTEYGLFASDLEAVAVT